MWAVLEGGKKKKLCLLIQKNKNHLTKKKLGKKFATEKEFISILYKELISIEK